MKLKKSCIASPPLFKYGGWYLQLLLTLTLLTFSQFAQAALVPNVTTPWVQSTYNVSASSSRSPNFLCTPLNCPVVNNPSNATDANLTNYSSITFPLISVFAYAELGVKETGTTYPAGTFAGFRIEKIGGLLDAGLFDNMTVTTYLGGAQRESIGGGSLIDGSLLGLIGGGSAGQFNVGFWTTQSFDEVRFRLSQPVGIGLGGETRVYSALLEQAAAGPTPTCNGDQGTSWTKPTYPVRVSESNTGISGICVGCEVTGASNIIDSNASNYANINILAGLLASGSVSVVDPLVGSYPGGTFAGFSVEDTGGLGGSLLNAFTLTTYLNGVQQESVGSGSLFDLPVFVGKHVVGFKTTQPFNEVKLSAGSLAGLNTNVHIYEAILAPDGCFTPYLNNSPIITSNGGGNTAAINVAENTTAVTTISASDGDGDPLTYSISGGADAAKFSINASTGVLTFISAPDYENPTDSGANNVYDVQVTVSDGTASDTQTIAVTVTNVAEGSAITCPAGSISTGSGYATGGTGLYKKDIFWLDWSCGAVTQFNAGDTITKTWTTPNGLAITGQMSNLTAAVQTYNTGAWSGDRLVSMYSGVNPIGLTNVTASQDPQFQLTFTTTLNGVALPNQIVIADAEDLDNTNESLTVTTDGNAFEALESQGAVDVVFSNAGKTIQLSDTLSLGSGTLLALTQNVNNLSVNMLAGGNGAVAFGVFAPFDYGDAITTTSNPSHYLPISASGGGKPIIATTGTLLTKTTVSVMTPTYLGTNKPDSDLSTIANSTATGDDTAGSADEDGVFTNSGLSTSLQGTTLNPEQNFSLHIPVKGTGQLYAWFDWDNNGVFGNHPDELVIDGLSGTNQTLTEGILVPMYAHIGTINARFRFSSDPAIASPTDTATDGEVEDYQVQIAQPASSVTPPSAVAPATCSATGTSSNWTAGGGGYQTTTTQGLVITAIGTAPSGANWSFTPNDVMNTVGDFGNPGINGTRSLGTVFYWDTTPESGRTANASTDGKTGTLTFNFSSLVHDPIIYIDRMGGYGGKSSATPKLLSSSARITPNAANAGITFTKVGGGTHFEVTANSIQRTPNEAMVWGESTGEAGADSTRQMAMGGVQILGSYNSLSFDLVGTGVEGAGGDGMEFVICADASSNAAPVITSNGGGSTAALTLSEGSTAVTTVTATDANAGDTLTYSITGGADAAQFSINATTGVLTFNSAPSYSSPTDANSDNVYEVQVAVNDGNGGTDTQALAVTITQTNSKVLEYTIRRGVDGRYHVYMRPTSTPTNNLNLTGQITLTVPTGSGANRFLINDLQSTVGSVTWALNSRVDAPTENTAQDYLSFTFTPLGNGNFNWQAGLEIEVFNFINPNTCTGLVDVMDDTDPFNIPTNSAGSVPANQFTNTGWGATTDNNYLGNYGSPVDCSTANNPPVITSDGGGATAALSVADGATTATAVSATDADNHTLTYSISGGADAAKFTINATTGLLSFVNPANYGSNFLLDPPEDSDGNNIYEVTVTVNDGHGGTDTQAISITVTSSPLLGLQLQVRVLLQGAYNSSTGLMNNTLAQLGLLPTVQPYTGLVGSLGLETVTSGVLNLLGNDAPVDWVLLEIRSASNPATVLLSIPSILQRDGDVINPATGSSLLSVTGLVLGSYHVSIRHRNHLGIITSTPVSLLSGSSTLVDFSVGSVGVGSSTRLTTSTGKTLLWAGDATTDDRAIANGPDNDVSPILSDVLLVPANTTLNANYIKSGYAKTDLNMDGKTIFAGPNNDINLLAGNVLIHPTNSTFSGNYVINGVIPK